MPNRDMFYTVLPPKDQKLRGVIVADSSVIFPLCTEVEDTLIARDAGGRIHMDPLSIDDKIYYHNLLSFLSDYGYAVIIPEMVAFECGQALFTPMSSRRGRMTNVSELIYDKELDTCQELPFRWLRQVAESAGHHELWVAPPPPGDRSEAAAFLGEAHSIINQDSPRDEKKNAFLRLEGRRSRDKEKNIHYGDIAARELVRRLDVPEGVPVFYLSGDSFAHQEMRAARGDVEIGKLNITGFVNAIDEAGLLRHVGFAEGVIAKDLLQDMYTKFRHNARRDSQIPYPSDVGVCAHNPELHANAFYESLAGIREELDALRAGLEASAHDVPLNFMAKFKAMYPPSAKSCQDRGVDA